MGSADACRDFARAASAATARHAEDVTQKMLCHALLSGVSGQGPRSSSLCSSHHGTSLSIAFASAAASLVFEFSGGHRFYGPRSSRSGAHPYEQAGWNACPCGDRSFAAAPAAQAFTASSVQRSELRRDPRHMGVKSEYGRKHIAEAMLKIARSSLEAGRAHGDPFPLVSQQEEAALVCRDPARRE